MQRFSGVSDAYGSPEFAFSEDGGVSWTAPQYIPGLETINVSATMAEAVADHRPVYHPLSESVLVIGCNSYYNAEGKCATEDDDFDADKYVQCPVYAAYRSDGTWSEKRKLTPKSFLKDSSNWRVACAQISVLSDGDLIIPIYLRPDAQELFTVCTVRCSFDGEKLVIKEVGPMVHSSGAGFGFCEPSVIEMDGKFYMTIRAYDKHGYWAESTDGLHWEKVKPWAWDSGDQLRMSETQQHWLTLQHKLYLVYTREDQSNKDIMRWRAPLFIAEVDRERRCLLRKTEQIVMPLEYQNGAAGLMGNFNVFNASTTEAIVTDAPIWFKIVKCARVEDDYLDDVRTDVWMAKVTA